MSNGIICICPRCSNQLISTRLYCNNCELELNGQFSLSKFDCLSADELNFVEFFMKAQGNFKSIQEELDMSYPALKKRLSEILNKLNLTPIKYKEESDKIMSKIEFLPIDKRDSLVVKKIKEKLNESGGKAMIPLYNDDLCDIEYDPNEKGLVSSKIPPKDQLIWEAFDAAVEVIINNGGQAPKGNARSGAKLGSTRLPLNSLEGHIAHKIHNVQIGQTAFGPGFVIAAVLEWAGICINMRGFVKITAEFMREYKN